MSEHDKIRELLMLAAAGPLTTMEEKQVVEHARSCIACANELESWRWIAADLRRLPTPQPSSRLIQATLALAEARFAEQAEHDWNRRVMIFVMMFAWLLTAASWLVFHFVSGHFGSLLGLRFGGTWSSFAAFTALAWLEGAVTAAMLAVRQRRERRMA